MRLLEIILGTLIIIAMALNIISFPRFQILIVLATGFTSMIYFNLSFAIFNGINIKTIFNSQSYQGISQLRLVGAILTGFALSIICIGILFRFQDYPNPNFILSIGIIGVLISCIVSIIKFKETKSRFYKMLLFRIAFYGILGLFILIFPKEKMVEIKYRNYPAFIQAYKNSKADPHNKELWKKVAEEREKIFEKK
jgi:hypothetical protein